MNGASSHRTGDFRVFTLSNAAVPQASTTQTASNAEPISVSVSVPSRTKIPISGPRKTRVYAARSKQRSGAEIAPLNDGPINQHALKLLPKWTLKPSPVQLHILTLVSAAQFATEATRATLKKMSTEWPQSEVMEYFSRVETFEELFLAQERPLEAVQVILAAVQIIAEPQRYISEFCLKQKAATECLADTDPSSRFEQWPSSG